MTDDAPEITPEEEPEEEAPLPKTGAEAWKERRALIMSRNSAARERGHAPSERADNRAADQQRKNMDRDSTQMRASNANKLNKRPRG